MTYSTWEAEAKALRAENERLREVLREVVEAYDWWTVDQYDRDQGVITDAIEDARADLKDTTP